MRKLAKVYILRNKSLTFENSWWYERFRLSISRLREELCSQLRLDLEPRSSDEVDTWAGPQRLTSETSYARTIGTLDSTDFTSTSVPVYSVGLYLASGIEPETLRSRVQRSINWATTALGNSSIVKVNFSISKSLLNLDLVCLRWLLAWIP